MKPAPEDADAETTTLATAALLAAAPSWRPNPNYADIQTVVVIYAENRSFDNLFGTFPGANGLANASPASVAQLDRDGKPMPGLPAIWGGTGSKVMEGAPVAPAGLTEGQRPSSWTASTTPTMSQRYTRWGAGQHRSAAVHQPRPVPPVL